MCPHKKFVESWARAIQNKAPEITVEIYPNDTQRDNTEFILAFNPEEGAFAHYPNLKVVASMGAGVGHILQNKGLPKNAIVTKINNPEHQRDVAYFVLSLILNYQRRLLQYTQYKSKQLWRPHSYKRPQDQTVGILGFGAIGQEVAKILLRNDYTVTGWSRHKKEVEGVTSFYGENQRNDFLKTADILVCCLPLTPQTKGILNAELFAALPDKAYLINIGRGAELNEDDLLTAIHSKKLSGAALDVFTTEPLPANHPFWTEDNIMITPHNAGNSHPEIAVKTVLQNFKAYQENRPLIDVVNKDQGY